MTKTINCAECNVEYTYEPVKNYPDKRKYCANCSEAKQKQWEQKGSTAADVEVVDMSDTVSGGSEYETVKMNEPVTVAPKGVYVNLAEKPKKSYELTDGNIRIGALTNAVQISNNVAMSERPYTNEIFWDKVKEFEEYIRNGK